MFSGFASPPAGRFHEFVEVVLGDDLDAGVDEGVNLLAAGDLRRGQRAELADLGRELGDRTAHRPVLDGLERIVRGVEAHDHERLARRLGRVRRTQRHLVVGGEDALEVRVGGQQVLGHGLALGAVGVGRLDGDDLEARLLHGFLGALFAQVMHRVAGCTADDRHFVARLQRLGDELAAKLAAELVVRAHERRLLAEVGQVGVHQDHRDAGRHGLLQRRLHLVGLRRRHRQRIHPRRNLRLDDADLAFDVRLLVRAEERRLDARIGLHRRLDARAHRLPVVARHRLDDHRDVQRLRLAAGCRSRGGLSGRRGRGRCGGGCARGRGDASSQAHHTDQGQYHQDFELERHGNLLRECQVMVCMNCSEN